MNRDPAHPRSDLKSSGAILLDVLSVNGPLDTTAVPKLSRITVLRHQISFVDQFTLNELGLKIAICYLEGAFDCSCAVVKRSLQKGQRRPKLRSNQNALPDNSEADVLAGIQDQAENSQPPTRTDIHRYCDSKFGDAATCDCVD
jgi:hypothetical protein